MIRTSFLLTTVTLFILAPTLLPAVPGLVSYQGRLTTAAGDPVPDGTYFLRFQIYDAPTSGTSLWNSNIQPVVVADGVYTYLLGQDIPLPDGLFNSGNRWLGVTVGADPELTPRQQFLATGFAFVSQNADSVNWGGIRNVPAGFADGVDNINTGDITAVNTSGGLTGGATSGDANIAIANGGVTSVHIGDGQIVDADISAGANIAASKLSGVATLAGTQTFTGENTFDDTVRFTNNTMQVADGQVVLGQSATLPPLQQGILRIDRTANAGILGMRGMNIYLVNQGTGPAIGLESYASSPSGNVTGVYSFATKPTGTTSGSTEAVVGSAYEGATASGVSGRSSFGIEGRGVMGEASKASYQGIGAHGLATECPNLGIGVSGQATTSAYAIGVYGEAWNNTVDSKAGYFAGDVVVSGTIFMPAFATRIDHPADPESKYLQHAEVVSPDMLNIYTGNITTDAYGDAVVVLPEYFAAINSDFRYQLTVIGQFAQAIIAETISNNQFKIRTDRPNVAVSWQVTGIRQDPFAKTNRVPVEVAKSPREVGKYQNPEAYGLSPERGMTAELRAAALKAAAGDHEPPRAGDAEKKR